MKRWQWIALILGGVAIVGYLVWEEINERRRVSQSAANARRAKADKAIISNVESHESVRDSPEETVQGRVSSETSNQAQSQESEGSEET